MGLAARNLAPREIGSQDVKVLSGVRSFIRLSLLLLNGPSHALFVKKEIVILSFKQLYMCQRDSLRTKIL